MRIFAAAQHNFGRGRGEIIAVHKVKTRVLRNAFKQRVRLRLVHRVPAHMRHFELVAVRIVLIGGKAFHLAGKPAQARCVALFAVVEQQLRAHANAEKRFVFQAV